MAAAARAFVQFCNVFPHTVIFQIHRVAHCLMDQVCMAGSVRDDRYTEVLVRYTGNGEADPIHGNGAFFNDEVQDAGGSVHRIPDGIAVPLYHGNGSGAVNVAGNNMSAKPPVCSHCPLQVHKGAGFHGPKSGTCQGFRHDISRETGW